MARPKYFFNSALMRGKRRAKGMTLQELGDALGVHEQQVHRWETGKACPLTKNIKALGKYFNVDWTLFLSRTDAIAWDNATTLIAEKAMGETADPDALKDALVLGALPSNFPEDIPVSNAEAQGAEWLEEEEEEDDDGE